MRIWRAREITIVVSLGLHGVIAAAALSAAHDKKVRRATTVSIVDEKKKKPEPKKPEPPKPPPPRPPPPKPAAAKPAAAPAPTAAAAPAPAAPSAPLQTNIGMSNDVGMDVGGGARPEQGSGAQTPKPPKPAATAVTKALKVDAPPPPQNEEGECTEPPNKPEPTMKTDIEYTEEARASGIEGRLVLEVTVDAQGNVTDVVVLNGVDAALDAAAIATVKTWRFKPAQACGKPVAGGKYKIARRFELGD